MSKKGFVSSEMFAGRGLSHGEITDLTEDFKLSGDNPFTINVVPKANITDGVISAPDNHSVLVDCVCYLDDNNSVLPIPLCNFTEAAIVAVKANAINLEIYRVFWMSGADVEQS